MGHGDVGVKTRHHGVVSPHMKKFGGRTRFAPSRHHVEADASPSDLASHHLWEEPSATDTTAREWLDKRVMEKQRGRNMDPFEYQAEKEMMFAAEEVTGPCGCTLKIGERVLCEGGRGQGVILGRSNRVLKVALDDGTVRSMDQKFLHRVKDVKKRIR